MFNKIINSLSELTMKKKDFLPYRQARKIVIDAGIKSVSEFNTWTDRPDNIPANPVHVYQNSKIHGVGVSGQWVSWYDFLGKDKNDPNLNIHKGKDKKKFLTYEEAKKIVHKAGISTASEYFRWEGRPNNIPANPVLIYKESVDRGAGISGAWVDWYDYLGKSKNVSVKKTGKTSRISKKFLTYEQARLVVIKAGVKSAAQYFKWRERPENIPFMPNNTYAGRGWSGWKAYLGKEFVSLEELKSIIKDNNIKTEKELMASKRIRSKYNIPLNLPMYYKDQGYTSFKALVSQG